MGYTTEFKGELKFTNPLTIEQLNYLETMLGINPGEVPGFKQSAKLGYIQYDLNKDRSGLQWDGNEKFYYAENACNFILENMQTKFPEFGLEGELLAQGEEIGDIWKLVIKEGRAVREEVSLISHTECPNCGHKL